MLLSAASTLVERVGVKPFPLIGKDLLMPLGRLDDSNKITVFST